MATAVSVSVAVVTGGPPIAAFAYKLYVYPTYSLYVKPVFPCLARLECDEDRHPSRVRPLARPLLVRQRLLHALHEAGASRGDLLAVPSLLYGQAEAGWHRR